MQSKQNLKTKETIKGTTILNKISKDNNYLQSSLFFQIPLSPYALQKPLRLYAPDILDLPGLLKANGHDDWLRHQWKLLYIITVVYRARWVKTHKKHPFVPIHAKTLEKVIGSRYAAPALRLLQKLNILEGSKSYKAGRNSKGYRFTEPYQSAMFRLSTSTSVPKRKAVTFQQIRLEDCDAHRHLLQSLNRVSVADSVYDFLSSTQFDSNYQRDFYWRSVEFIQQKDWFFTSDPKTGRAFNNITSFPKSLRPFLRLDGKELAEVDIVNCQPFLLLGLYQGEPERKQFADAVAGGTFYEMLDAELETPFGASRRDELKAAVFGQVLFDRVRNKPTRLCKAFAARFSILFKKICADKTPDYRRLALTLQSLEAEIIIAGVVREIANGPKFPVLTIHDSILTFPDLIPDVCSMIEKAFLAKLGAVPRLKIRPPTDEAVVAIAA